VSAGVFSTPRPVPGRLVPALAAGGALLLALPIFVVASFPLEGWLLATVLWLGGLGLSLLLTRLRPETGNLAPAGVLAISMTFRAVAVMLVLVAATVSDARLGLSALLLYAFAYSLELALSLAAYFGGPTRA